MSIKMEQNKFEKPLISRRSNIEMTGEREKNKVIITSKSVKKQWINASREIKEKKTLLAECEMRKKLK